VLFVGSGELYSDLKDGTNVLFDGNAVLSLQNNGVNISITGFLNQSEIVKAYVAADCLVLPSDYNETWGLVVNEAMACGIPAIVSDQCGSAEDLARSVNEHLTFPCGDTSELSRSIMHLLKNRIDADLISSQISKFSYQSTIGSIKKILLEHR
jgi:glycosyltransferase involved in cell wall biosynthesis